VTREVTEMRGHAKHSRRFGAAWSLVLPALLVLVVGQGCEWEDSSTAPTDRTLEIPWALNLNYRAVNMAVGEVVQFTVSPRNAAGEALTGLPPVVYITTNPDVTVDANGKMTARAPASTVVVTATMTDRENNWTVKEQARVTVVATPYEVGAFRMQLNGPTIVPANRTRRFDAVVDRADISGTVSPMTFYEANVPWGIYYMSNQWTGTGTTRGIGQVTIRGTAYIFGTVYSDSVKFQTTYPDASSLYIWPGLIDGTTLDPMPSVMVRTDVTILKGGTVTFINQNPTMDSGIVFDDEANVVGGNIAVVPASPGKAVTFPNTGKFTYKTSFGATGTITVVDWPAQP